MEGQLVKLQAATDEAYREMQDCQQAMELTDQLLQEAKTKYKALPAEEQKVLQVNDTELPELIQAHILAKNQYETVSARYQTNQRYLNALKAKMGV